MAADLRAPTPSAASELAVPVKTVLRDDVDAFTDDLTRALEQQIAQKRLRLTTLQQRLTAASPAQRSERLRASLAALEVRLHNAVSNAVQQKRNRAERALLRIRASGPMETMKRGYAVVMKNDALVRSVSGVLAGDQLRILLADGAIEAIAQSAKADQA